MSVCIANASALFHEYGDGNSKMTSYQIHKQLPVLLYEVKASCIYIGCNWKGSFAGEEVLASPQAPPRFYLAAMDEAKEVQHELCQV